VKATIRGLLPIALTVLALHGCSDRGVPSSAARLVIPTENDIQTLDPTRLSDPYTSRIVWQVFEGLVGLDADGHVLPLLAERWTTSPDSKRWRFTIRPGVRFHEHSSFGSASRSRTVTAQDVAYSYHRFAKGFGAFVFRGLVEGFDAYLEGHALSVSGFRAVDATTFEFTLVRPDPAFLFRITSPYLGIMPREVIEGVPDAFGVDVAIGTGPFRLVERKPTQVTLQRHAGYWRATAGNVQQVVFRVEKNPQFRLSRLEDGGYDLLELPLVFAPKYLGSARPPHGQAMGLGVYTARSYNVHYMGIDNRQIGDVHLRRAIVRAVDKRSIVEKVLHGFADIATSPIPPGLQGFVPPPDPKYDPVAARRELQQATRPRRPLAILASDAANADQVAQVVRQNLVDIGLTVEIERVDFNTLITRVFGRARPPLFIMFSEWIYGAPELIVDSFDSKRFPNPNVVGFARPDVDQKLALLAQLTQRSEINERCREIAELANVDAPALWLYHQHHVFLMSRRVGGFSINGHQHWDLASVKLARG
jgi:peptide/nickel transport system substrate-binding protein